MKVPNVCLIVNAKTLRRACNIERILKSKRETKSQLYLSFGLIMRARILIANKITHIKRAHAVSLSLNFTVDAERYLIPLSLRLGMPLRGMLLAITQR